ncbi:PAS domain S-box protein [Bacteroidota bacterium]
MSSNLKYLKEIIKNVDAIVLVTGKKGKILHGNRQFLDTFSLKKDDLTGSYLKKFVLYDKNGKKIKFADYPFNIAAANRQSVIENIYKFLTPDKKIKWYSVNSLVAQNDEGELDSVISTFWDITDKMEVEEFLNETIENIDSVLYSISGDGSRINFITDTVNNMFGYSPEEIFENRFSILKSIHKNDFHVFRRFVDNLKKGKETVAEYHLTDKFGKERTLRHSGHPIMENNKVQRVVGIIQDITRERKIQEELKKSEEKFNLLTETAADLIFILDKQGYFEKVNFNGAQALGYKPDEITGKHFLDFIDAGCKADVSEALENILSEDSVVTFETNFLDKSRNIIIFEIQARSTKSNGEISGMLSIGRDITYRKRDEDKLKELNSKLVEANRIISIERERAKHQITVLEEVNKLKSKFVSNVSHELRTPLASIVGFAETIATDTELLPEMVQEFSSIILTEGKRLAKLINDILDFSKLDVGEEELVKNEFNLILLIKGLVKSYGLQASEKGMSLTSQLPKTEIIINADKERLANALGHLLSNSIKFSNEGGRITVIVQDFDKEVEIMISDTGIGIPENSLPNLFQKFSKVDRPGAQVPGAGFGLVTVKKIIDLHKGIIQVKSEIDKGSTFLIRLPK